MNVFKKTYSTLELAAGMLLMSLFYASGRNWGLMILMLIPWCALCYYAETKSPGCSLCCDEEETEE